MSKAKAGTVLPMTPAEPDFIMKIILIGDSGVGKTNLLSQFARGIFNPDSKTTIGVEFATKTIKLPNGKIVKAQIWDTAGQERYRAITQGYYRNAEGAIILYDITSSISFQSVGKWLEEIRQHRDPTIDLMLIGNKSDLESSRSVDIGSAKTFAENNKMLFMETSAKESTNVQAAFEALIERIVEKRAPQGFDASAKKDSVVPQGISIKAEEPSSDCC